MTMAKYIRGNPVRTDYLPATSYSAGDIIVINSLPLVATSDNPVGIGTNLIQGSLSCLGGVYQILADAGYGVGTYVYWNTLTQRITTTEVPGVTFPFGWIVAGVLGLASDGGTTGANTYAYVLHEPTNPLTYSQNLAFPRNLIDGGDFSTNPWQRASTALFTAGVLTTPIAATVTYGPDRFFAVGGASSSILFSQIADTTLAGFSQSCKVSRSVGNTNNATINFGQVLESIDCIKVQGQPITLSFYAKAGANYSGGNLTVAINHSLTSGNDSSAHLVAASTNWQATPSIINTTQALTTGWTRYQFTGTVPALATQLGLLISWTPSTTAAGADDSIYFQGIQLELGSGASNFEHRDAELELALAQRYAFVIQEPASGVVVGTGMITTANNQLIYVPFPTQMYKAPAVSVVAGSFKFNIAGTATAVGGGFAAGSTHTPNAMSLVGTVTATAGQATNLQGGAGVGYILASADF